MGKPYKMMTVFQNVLKYNIEEIVVVAILKVLSPHVAVGQRWPWSIQLKSWVSILVVSDKERGHNYISEIGD